MDHLQVLFEDMGLECQSYSGRGMYGKQCLGIQVPDQTAFLSGVIERVASGDYSEHAEYIAEAFMNMKVDSLGRDIVVYFQGAKYSPPPDDQGPLNY